MKLITVHMPEPYLTALEELKDAKLIPNRAEGIRTAVREYLKGEGKL